MILGEKVDFEMKEPINDLINSIGGAVENSMKKNLEESLWGKLGRYFVITLTIGFKDHLLKDLSK